MVTYEDIGESIGKNMQGQQKVQENLSPNDPEALLNVVSSEAVGLSGTLTVTKKIYADDSFVIDHPVQGDVDSAVYLIDGGYKANFILYTSGSFTYPGTYSGGVFELYTITY